MRGATCRKIMAGGLVLLFIPVGFALLIAIPVRLTLFNPTYIKQRLERADVYAALADQFPKALAVMFAQGRDPDDPQIQIIVKTVEETLSANWLAQTVGGILDELDRYLRSPPDTAETIAVTIDLSALKRNFRTNFLRRAIEEFEHLPACTAADMKKLEQDEEQTLACLPPNISKDKLATTDMEGLLGGQLEIIDQLPDQWDLGALAREKGADRLESWRRGLYFLKLATTALAALAGLLLLLIGLLVWRPARSVIRWLATALIIPALLVAFLGSVLLATSQALVTGYAQTLPASFKALLLPPAQALVTGFPLGLLWSAGLALGLALLGYLAAAFLPRPFTVSDLDERRKRTD